jgi:AraC-like DNA-binding protein/ligand-binding sensor protein
MAESEHSHFRGQRTLRNLNERTAKGVQCDGMNGSDEIIGRIAESSTFRDYAKAFSDVTGMPIALRSVDSWQLPHPGSRGENRFCALMAGQSRSCAAFLQMQETLARVVADSPCTLTCSYGLAETAAPVKLGSQTVALLQTGQVFTRKPTEPAFRKAMSKAGDLGGSGNFDNARRAFFGTPVIAPDKIESVGTMLATFSDHLAMKMNQIAMQRANAVPQTIAKAIEFIRDHHAETLSLPQVAGAVRSSVFYFCKLFSKATGKTFTEHVSHVRIERAKQLLLNPNLRISEIAYAVGFQSLAHFNRVFRRVAGETPTAYREIIQRFGNAR